MYFSRNFQSATLIIIGVQKNTSSVDEKNQFIPVRLQSKKNIGFLSGASSIIMTSESEKAHENIARCMNLDKIFSAFFVENDEV